ncbi:MAG: YkvA family protein [Victivallales bacterium]
MTSEEKWKMSIVQFIGRMRMLFLMLRDWWRGTYRDLPWWCIGVLIFTLIYVLSPLDLIPDAIPFIGVLDDVSLMYLCYKIIEGELEKYSRWRAREEQIIDVKAEKA